MVLKCTLKPIAYIFFPFFFLGILLWNIGYKTDYNFNQGISIKQIISVSYHLSVLAGREIMNMKGLIDGKPNIDLLLLTAQNKNFICNGFIGVFPGLRIVSKTSQSDVYSRRGSVLDVNKHIAEIDNVIHDDLFVSLSDISVWINELDGANYFAEGVKFVTISICVVFRGHPIVSVIHHPFSNETYWAWIGYYKSKNILLKLRRMKKRKTILISKSLDNNDIHNQTQNIFGNQSIIKAISGTGYKTLMIIKGLADYFYHPIPIHKCDICASYILLLASKGFAFSITSQMSKATILNKTMSHYREKLKYSLDQNKWLPGILYGKEN